MARSTLCRVRLMGAQSNFTTLLLHDFGQITESFDFKITIVFEYKIVTIKESNTGDN